MLPIYVAQWKKIFFTMAFLLAVVTLLAWGATPTHAGIGSTFIVTNTNNSGAGSLRQAILDANANAGLDLIAFNVPGSGVAYIVPATDLPAITDPVIVDGYSQPGSSSNTSSVGTNAVLQVWVDGKKTKCQCALDLKADESTIMGLTLDAPNSALIVDGSGNTIGGNIIGMDAGALEIPDVKPTQTGIWVNGNGNHIGGTTLASRNLITGNTKQGVFINQAAQSNQVQGNLIGTLKDGQHIPSSNWGFGNATGIKLWHTSHNTVGGTDPTMRNVIAGNRVGVALVNGSNLNFVQNNYIGVSATGASFVNIAYYDPGTIGVLIDDSSNNAIGTDLSSGVYGNVIVGSHAGLYLQSTCQCSSNPGENWILNNYIGTDATGQVALKVGTGVIIDAGGLNAINNNVISGNQGQGILIRGKLSVQNVMHGNKIGVDVNGNPLGNGGSGVFLRDGTTRNEIGMELAQPDNTIAYNGGNGVTILHSANGTETRHNQILNNLIYGNKKLGIDLGNNGVTADDTKDPDKGPNDYQNYPALTQANFTLKQVSGHLNSTPNSTYRIEFFLNQKCDPSGHGQGGDLIGATTVTTDLQGNASFTYNVLGDFWLGYAVSATATDQAQTNTSEFSSCVKVGIP